MQLEETLAVLDKVILRWDELVVQCNYAEVDRSLLETSNKEKLLEKASTKGAYQKDSSVVKNTCKTTGRIVGEFFGGPLKRAGPLLQQPRLVQQAKLPPMLSRAIPLLPSAPDPQCSCDLSSQPFADVSSGQLFRPLLIGLFLPSVVSLTRRSIQTSLIASLLSPSASRVRRQPRVRLRTPVAQETSAQIPALQSKRMLVGRTVRVLKAVKTWSLHASMRRTREMLYGRSWHC